MTARSDGRNAVWPPPVYVASLANGATVRMSFYSRRGKPLDFERGRRVCEGTIHDDGRHIDGLPRWARGSMRALMIAEQPDLRPHFQHAAVAGHVEIGEKRLPDPHFAKVVPMVAKARAPVAVQAVADGSLLGTLRAAHETLDGFLRGFNMDRPAALSVFAALQRQITIAAAEPADSVHYPKAWRRP